MTRILLYGDIDLNLIDGSSVWLASLAEVLARDDAVEVSVLLKAPVRDATAIAALLAHRRIRFIDPWADARADPAWAGAMRKARGAAHLTPESAARVIELADRRGAFDLVVVRADAQHHALARILCRAMPAAAGGKTWLYIADARGLPPSDLEAFAGAYRRIVCQTPQARAHIAARLANPSAARLLVLPPMIPECPGRPPLPEGCRAERICYAGKFSREYYIDEMLDAFREARRDAPRLELHIVGDKFMRRDDAPEYERRLAHRFAHEPGVIWHGRRTRAATWKIIGECHIAFAWRHPMFDDSLELSTKALEYAAHGLPIIMSRARVHEQLFGADYPLYVRSHEECADAIRRLHRDRECYNEVSLRVARTTPAFTYDAVAAALGPAVLRDIGSSPAAPPRRPAGGARKLLFAGHDLRFLEPIIRHFSRRAEYAVETELWRGHEDHDERRSRALLAWADIVFSEWCLGNACWHAAHKRPGQRLIVRLHHQEMELRYRREVAWQNVDALIFICPRHRETFERDQPAHASRARLIVNAVDCDALDAPKLPGAQFNLGLVGMNPRRKRPDLALEILARLRERDSRWTLSVKSRMPWEHPWLWEQERERDYYAGFFRALEAWPHRNAVVFDPYGDDMAQWYSKIGVVLSTSDHEGSHQSIAEGMACGSIPIIRNWHGAAELYPPRFVFSTADDAVRLIRSAGEADAACVKAHARAHFDVPLIAGRIEELFDAR
ncbi:MAG TPA: hypothetical protein DCM87_10260 [Planctomycetes bacterium]|nr:hypothetical protein [Planctomycetota bacterium]